MKIFKKVTMEEVDITSYPAYAMNEWGTGIIKMISENHVIEIVFYRTQSPSIWEHTNAMQSFADYNVLATEEQYNKYLDSYKEKNQAWMENKIKEIQEEFTNNYNKFLKLKSL